MPSAVGGLPITAQRLVVVRVVVMVVQGGGGGGAAESSVNTNTAPRDVDAGYAAYMASPERREERLQYAQAMYPNLSEADALRKLNDRNG